MKKIILMILPFLLASCASKKGAAAFIGGKHKIESPCPETAGCSFEILKGKSLIIKTDDTGKLYYSLQDAADKLVVRYAYTKKSTGYEDDGYSEEIIFETGNELSGLQNTNPKEVKLLFGVHCFCRGKAGFYRVEEGTVTYADESLHVRIPDNIIDQQQISGYDVSLAK